MYLNWIPQNIQKRVFLYILQQLSFFSGIELPNLEEVSYNNIHLRDVALDPEKITKIPGLRLRHGNLVHVILKGNVKDGARLDISGVLLVVAPSIDNLRQDLENAQSLLAQSSAELALTILLDSDLPLDVLNGSETEFNDVDMGENADNQDGLNPSPTHANDGQSDPKKSSNAARRPSFSDGIMSRATDMALLKLQVKVANVSVKILVDPVDLLLYIDEIVFSYKSGVKILSIKGVKVSVGRPFRCLKGHTNSPCFNLKHQQSTSETSENDTSDDSDSGNDSSTEVLAETGVNSLTDSMVFTHEEASSVYMSATSQAFGNPQKIDLSVSAGCKDATMLFHVDFMDLLFENLSHLKMDIDTIKVSAVPLLPTVSVVLNSLTKLFKLNIHQLRKKNALNRASSRPESRGLDEKNDAHRLDKEELSEDGSSGGSFFDKFHIHKLEVSLTSALTSAGAFASFDDEVNVVLTNFTLKLKDDNLTYGGLETLEVLRYVKEEKSHVFQFENADPTSVNAEVSTDENSQNTEKSGASKKADFRFEYALQTSELTLLFSRSSVFELDTASLKYLVNFTLWISAVNDNLGSLMKAIAQSNEILGLVLGLPVIQKLNKTPELYSHAVVGGFKTCIQITLQTASFQGILKLSPTMSLRAFVFPISFEKTHDHVHLPKINIEMLTPDTPKRCVMTGSNIAFHYSPTKFDTFHYSVSTSAPQKSSLKTSKSLVVGDISGSLTRLEFASFLSELKTFLDAFATANNVNCVEAALIDIPSPTKPRTGPAKSLLTSIYSSQTRFKHMNHTQIMFGTELHTPGISMRVFVQLVHLSLTEITDAFGGLKLKAQKMEMVQPGNGMCGHISSVQIKRNLAASESLLCAIPGSSEDFPMVQFRRKSNETFAFEVMCRGCLVDYHTNWVKLLGGPERQTGVSEENSFDRSCFSHDLNLAFVAEFRLLYHDFALGINPGRLASKLYLKGSSGSLDAIFKNELLSVKSSFRDLALWLTDDVKHYKHKHGALTARLLDAGYVNIGGVNLVHIGLNVSTQNDSLVAENPVVSGKTVPLVDFRINVDNVGMDLCADSAQTLIQTLSDLKEPVVFKDEEKFRVRPPKDFVLPQDAFESLSSGKEGSLLNGQGNSFQADLTRIPPEDSSSHKENFIFIDEYYNQRQSKEDEVVNQLSNVDLNESPVNPNETSSYFQVIEGHFIEKEGRHNQRVDVPFSMEANVNQLEVYLHDGYDRKSTRKSIKAAVQAMEKKSVEATSESAVPSVPGKIEKNESHLDKNLHAAKLTQTLFQSIHIDMNKNAGVSHLVEIINAQVAGEKQPQSKEVYENEAQTNVKVDKSYKDLKLRRSVAHKISVETRNIAVKFKAFLDHLPNLKSDDIPWTSRSRIVNQAELLVDSVVVKDNVQSSTWDTMLTYMSALGERESGTNMAAVNVTNVRPDALLPYTEAVISVKILPLRLFVDQDTLAFATRFFAFRDARFALPVDEMLFVQKLCVDPLRIKFDYKPKSIDYTGIRAGNNAELANFFILDGSDLKLQKAVVYGAHGIPKLGRALAAIYGPYIQKHQLSGLLSGLSPVKSILNVGHSVRDLVVFPIQEYRRDGRMWYGLQKGSLSFAKTTTNELLRLGVKLASGAQVILENLEEYLGGEGALARQPVVVKDVKEKPLKGMKNTGGKPRNLLESSQILRRSVALDAGQLTTPKPVLYNHSTIDEEDLDTDVVHLQSSILVLDDSSEGEELAESGRETGQKVTSLYSNQPANASEGLRSAYKAMGKNLRSSKITFRELKRELKNADTLQEQLVSVAKKSPVLVIRPLIGGTEAMMKTLIGISNGIDSRALQESREKYRTDHED